MCSRSAVVTDLCRVVVVSSSVDHLISYILVSIAEDLGAMSTDAYRLKVHGLSEYLVKSVSVESNPSEYLVYAYS